MFGNEDFTNGKANDLGLIPRSVEFLFNELDNNENILKYSVNIAVVEIYMEVLTDLLNPIQDVNKRKKLEILSLKNNYFFFFPFSNRNYLCF